MRCIIIHYLGTRFNKNSFKRENVWFYLLLDCFLLLFKLATNESTTKSQYWLRTLSAVSSLAMKRSSVGLLITSAELSSALTADATVFTSHRTADPAGPLLSDDDSAPMGSKSPKGDSVGGLYATSKTSQPLPMYSPNTSSTVLISSPFRIEERCRL